MLAYSSPWLFAVNRVLRRLLMPRHSPCALVHLTVLLELYEFFVLVYPYTEKLQYRIVQFSRYNMEKLRFSGKR